MTGPGAGERPAGGGSGTLVRARAALADRDFRLLLAGRLLSQVGDGFFQAYLVARIVFLNPEGHSTAIGVAKAYAVLVIPFSVVGPLSGVLVDRWSRRRILVITPIVRAATAISLLPSAGGTAWMYVPALIAVSLNRFFLTTATSSIPTVVAREDLLLANSMSTVGGTVLTFVGIVAGTKLIDPIGPAGVLVVTACCWPAASFLASRIRRPLRPGAADPGRGSFGGDLRRMVGDLRAGARRLVATPRAIGPIVSISLDQFLIGFVTVLSLVVFKQRFHQGVGAYGNILAAGGLGVLAGTVTVGTLEDRWSTPAIAAGAFALSGLVSLAVAPAIAGFTVLLESFALGLTFAWRKICVDTMVQRAVPDRYRGRVFAVYDLTYSMARVAAAGLAVALIPELSPGWLLAGAGVVYLAWAPVLPWWAGRPRRVGLRFYAGGTADETPRALIIGGAEEPVEVLGSWNEERDGHRIRRFRLRLEGEVVEVIGRDRRWTVDRGRSEA